MLSSTFTVIIAMIQCPEYASVIYLILQWRWCGISVSSEQYTHKLHLLFQFNSLRFSVFIVGVYHFLFLICSEALVLNVSEQRLGKLQAPYPVSPSPTKYLLIWKRDQGH